MKATLLIYFDDGSYRELIIDKAVELDVSPNRRQSIEFRETAKGWVMSYAKPLLLGQKLSEGQFLLATKIHESIQT